MHFSPASFWLLLTQQWDLCSPGTPHRHLSAVPWSQEAWSVPFPSTWGRLSVCPFLITTAQTDTEVFWHNKLEVSIGRWFFSLHNLLLYSPSLFFCFYLFPLQLRFPKGSVLCTPLAWCRRPKKVLERIPSIPNTIRLWSLSEVSWVIRTYVNTETHQWLIYAPNPITCWLQHVFFSCWGWECGQAVQTPLWALSSSVFLSQHHDPSIQQVLPDGDAPAPQVKSA